MKRTRPYSPLTKEACHLLGSHIAVARRERRWTAAELAERVGVSRPTIHKIERGEVTVAIGAVFEAAVILGVPLFGDDPARRRLEAARLDDRLAVLPQAVRRPTRVRDDF